MFSALFSSRKRTPTAIVDALRDAISHAGSASDERGSERARDEIARHMCTLKIILLGDESGSDNVSPPSEKDCAEIVKLACREDVLALLAENLHFMGFETRKDAVQVFNHLIRQEIDDINGEEQLSGTLDSLSLAEDAEHSAEDVSRENLSQVPNVEAKDSESDDLALQGHRTSEKDASTQESGCVCRRAVDQVAKQGEKLMSTLLGYYDDSDIALNAGAMLRECLRDELLTQILLESDVFWKYFELVEKSDFDVASDAFTSFKDTLTRHQQIAASFMQSHFERFVKEYNGLMRSPNYVTRRQSLKLLGEMLIERANFNIMTRYIASAENLKLIMNLLLDSRRNIQFEAFHIFKVFVANPNKPPEIYQILLRNKTRLLAYLRDFLVDREDEQFHADRLQIIEEIEYLS